MNHPQTQLGIGMRYRDGRRLGRLRIAVFSFALAACGEPSFEESLQRGRDSLESRKLPEATVAIKQALQRNAQHPEARYLLGRTYLELGDTAAAVQEFDKALQAGQSPDLAVPLLARALVQSGQSRRVISELATRALTQPRAMAELKSTVALAYLAEGNNAAAAVAVDAALKADPSHAAARLLHARRLAGSGALNEALAAVQGVLDADPNLAEAWLLRGEFLHGDPARQAQAVAAYERALKVESRMPSGHVALVDLALDRRDLVLARVRLTAMKQALPIHTETLVQEARLAFLANEDERVRELAQQLLKRAPRDLRFNMLAAEGELRLGAVLSAEKHAEQAMALAPDAYAPRVLLARLRVAQGEPSKALALLEPFLAASPTPTPVLATAAEAALLAGQTVRAKRLFERAAKADATDPRFVSAVALSGVVDSTGPAQAKALSQLERLSASDATGFASVVLMQAKLHLRDFTGAAKALDAAQTQQPENPGFFMLRGHMLQQQRNPAGAVAAFENALKVAPRHLAAVLALADNDLSQARPRDALQRMERWLAVEPTNYRARLALAELQRRAGATDAEIGKTIEEAVRLNPDRVAPLVALIRHHIETRNPRAAVSLAATAATTHASNPAVLEAIADAQLAASEPRQAIATLKRWVDAAPTQAAPLLRLADAYVQTGEIPIARRHLQQALALAPGLLQAERRLVELAVAEKQWSSALDASKRVQQRLPTRFDGFAWEGGVHAAQRHWGPAAVAFRAALHRGADVDVAIKLHVALLAGTLRGEADRVALEWMAGHPGDRTMLRHLGDVALAETNYAQAEKHYRAAANGGKEDPLLLNNLAWSITRQGKSGAAEFAERANELMPNQAPLLDTWAAALALEKNPTRALAVQRQAVAIAPEALRLRLGLARIAHQAGDIDLARSELVKLTAHGTAFSDHAAVSALANLVR